MKWLQTKKALYYLCALIVLIGYQILCAILYNQRGAEYLLDDSHYFLFMNGDLDCPNYRFALIDRYQDRNHGFELPGNAATGL